MSGIVYGLADPRTGAIRYVGQSSQGLRRARDHATPACLRADGKIHKTRWLNQLVRLGLRPEIRVLEEVPVSYLDDVECFWIAQGRGLGWPLTNHTKGGGGRRGFHLSPETREKIAAKLRANAALPGYRNPSQGTKHRPESIEKMRVNASIRTGPLAPEHCARISLGKKKAHFHYSPESKAKMRAAKVGKPLTPEHVAKIVATKARLKRKLRGQLPLFDARLRHFQ